MRTPRRRGAVGTNSKNKPPEGEVRITALTAKDDKPVLKYNFKPAASAGGNVSWESQIGGLAAHDGMVVVSLPSLGRLLLVDAQAGSALGEVELDAPHGLAFDGQGRLLALSGAQLVRYPQLAAPTAPPPPRNSPLRKFS